MSTIRIFIKTQSLKITIDSTYRIQRPSSDHTDLPRDTQSNYRPHRSYTELTAPYIWRHTAIATTLAAIRLR